MKCCGTSLFLKNKFGIGYHLSMNMDENADVNAVLFDLTLAVFKFFEGVNMLSISISTFQVTELVQQHVKGAELGRQHGKEITYTLPINAVGSFVGELDALLNCSRL